MTRNQVQKLKKKVANYLQENYCLVRKKRSMPFWWIMHYLGGNEWEDFIFHWGKISERTKKILNEWLFSGQNVFLMKDENDFKLLTQVIH